jgi:hypothetical protein
LRDRTHGRIWRVVHEDAPDHEPVSLSTDDPEALVTALGYENMFWRMTAQRLLVERGKADVVPMLYKQVRNTRTDALGNSPATRHAEGFMGAFIEENSGYTPPSKEDQDLINVQTAAFNDTKWETLQPPAIIENVGFKLDGRIWFRRNVDVPASLLGQTATIHLGEFNDKDETWINSKMVGSISQLDEKRVYQLPAGTLKAGSNLIAIMKEDFQNQGGFRSLASEMYLQLGNECIPLAGDWKYKVAEVFNRQGSVLEGTTVADLLVENYWQTEPESAVASAVSDADAQQG